MTGFTEQLRAFEQCGLHSVIIPMGIECINEGTFAGCTNLTSVSIPNSVTTIGNEAFSNCGFSSFNIPNSVTTIGNDAFHGCIQLTSVSIPNSVKSIGEMAFMFCFSLTSISIPESVESIGSAALSCGTNLTDVFCYTDRYLPRIETCFSDPSIVTLHVPDYAIESYKNAGYYTGHVWDLFKDIVPIEIVTDFSLLYMVDGEVYKTIQYKYNDEIVPEAEPTKKGHTFSGWGEIPERMPGKDVTVTGSFSWSKMTKDNIVYQVTDTINYCAAVIGTESVAGEIKIASSVEIDDNYKVTAIADKAIHGRRDVTKIEIPNSILSIGVRAFANIDNLTDVTIFADEVPNTDRTAFENSYIEYVTLHVPYGSIEKYKNVRPWKDFKEIVAIEGTEPVSVETCVMPIISFVDGKLVFECEMDDAECHYEIKVEDAKEGIGTEVTLSSAYEITVYASKEGYNDSEKNTATLYWVNVDPIPTGMIDNEMRVNTTAVLVQNNGGEIAITGVADGDNVFIYNISGQVIAQGSAFGGRVEIITNLSCGDICIIKIGDRSLKYILR